VRKLRLSNSAPLRDLIRARIVRSREQRFLHRLHCVLLVSEGRSCYEIARWFGEDPRTIERWVHALELHGIDGLRSHRSAGRPARLSAQRLEQLKRDLTQPPFAAGYGEKKWCGALLARHLQEHYGIRLSVRQCQRLLCRGLFV
jgi:transposase